MTFIFIQRTLNLYFHSPTYLAIRCCCVPAWLCVTMLFYAMHAPCRTHPNAYTHASSDSSTSSVEFCFQTLFENPLQGHNQRAIFVCHFLFDCFRLASSSVIRNRSNVWLIYIAEFGFCKWQLIWICAIENKSERSKPLLVTTGNSPTWLSGLV